MSILREISNCGVSDPVVQICRCCHSKSEIPYREFPEFDTRPVTQELAVRYRQAERISQVAGQVNAEGDGKAAAPGDEIFVDVFLVDQVVQKASQLPRIRFTQKVVFDECEVPLPGLRESIGPRTERGIVLPAPSLVAVVRTVI